MRETEFEQAVVFHAVFFAFFAVKAFNRRARREKPGVRKENRCARQDVPAGFLKDIDLLIIITIGILLGDDYTQRGDHT